MHWDDLRNVFSLKTFKEVLKPTLHGVQEFDSFRSFPFSHKPDSDGELYTSLTTPYFC